MSIVAMEKSRTNSHKASAKGSKTAVLGIVPLHEPADTDLVAAEYE